MTTVLLIMTRCTVQELAGLEKNDLVEMIMAAREEKASVEKRCNDLGRAFHHAQASLQELENEVFMHHKTQLHFLLAHSSFP